MRFMILIKADEDGGRCVAEPATAGRDGRLQGAVIDGPFTETKELLAGFWLWDVVEGGGDRVVETLPESHWRRRRGRTARSGVCERTRGCESAGGAEQRGGCKALHGPDQVGPRHGSRRQAGQ